MVIKATDKFHSLAASVIRTSASRAPEFGPRVARCVDVSVVSRGHISTVCSTVIWKKRAHFLFQYSPKTYICDIILYDLFDRNRLNNGHNVWKMKVK